MAYNLIPKFKKWNKNHKNFMTPDIISIKQKGNRIYELSEGTGFENEPIYGASELESKPDGNFQSTARGQMFHSEEKAKEHLKNLQQNNI